MAIFNESFYPTPETLIEKLLEPYRVNHYYNISGNILEPSAGKGDIAKFIDSKANKAKIYCIEPEPELQQILRGDGFPVIHTDFLSYQKDMFFDFIFMNPPFSNGEQHLLKAIEIASTTKIACILNAETIKNPYTESRKRLAFYLEKYGAKIEFVQNAFLYAERKTGVEVALIWLDIEKKENFFGFEYIKDADISETFDFDFSDFEIAKNDVINNLKIQSEKAKLALIEKIKADAKFEHYFNAFTGPYDYSKEWLLSDDNPEHVFSHFILKSKKYMWNYVLQYLDIKNYMSSSMIKDFDAFVAQQSHLAFNKENVFAFFNMVLNNRENITKQMIEAVFDNLTSFASANILPVPKWKTNSAYKINRKIIAPCYVTYGQYDSADYLKKYGSRFSLSYSDMGRSSLGDLDKVLCILGGKQQNEIISIQDALKHQFEMLGNVRTGDTYENVCYSTFFKIKFFKKGTIHLEFLDLDLWNEFNYQACLGKNWIPDDEKRKPEKERKTEKHQNAILELDFH